MPLKKMADPERHSVETTPPQSERGSISETYVEVKMEDVGGYSVHVDFPEKEKTRPTVTKGELVTSFITLLFSDHKSQKLIP